MPTARGLAGGLAACLAAAWPAAAVAQSSWRAIDLPAVGNYGLAYDSGRDRLVLFGGTYGQTLASGTWERRTADLGWTERRAAAAPPARELGRLAYDAARSRVVLFGGVSGTQVLGDTWLWDGAQWQPVAGPGPAPRYFHAMAYDNQRQRLVLHGGWDPWQAQQSYGDTWEWDGAVWQQVSPGGGPGVRTEHALAYDPSRGRVALVGGRLANATWSQQHWEWDGAAWSQRATTGLLPGVRSMAMAFDAARSRLMLLARELTVPRLYELVGTTWQARQSVAALAGVTPAEMVYDAAASALVVSQAGRSWQIANNLVQPMPRRADPGQRTPSALVFSSRTQQLTLVGGSSGAVYSFAAGGWQLLDEALTNPRPTAAAVADDPLRQRLVLFGGIQSGVLQTGTWEWNGSQWLAAAPAQSPPPRQHHGMVFDTNLQEVLLFGGEGLGSPVPRLGDTWRYDGTTWTPVVSAVAPSPRSQFGFAHDPVRRRSVLHGGVLAGGTYSGETWEFDGAQWLLQSPATVPPATAAVAAYDPAVQRVVLGAMGTTTAFWHWDGSNWALQAEALPVSTPPIAFAVDPVRQQRLLLNWGNPPSSGAIPDTWLFAAGATAASTGPGCAGSLGAPALGAVGAAAVFGGSLQLQLQGVPNGVALLASGLGDTAVAGQPLPLDLGSFGAPGCALRVEPLATQLLLGGPAIGYGVPIPPDLALLGQALYLQALVLDPPANPGGFTVSNALRAQIGW